MSVWDGIDRNAFERDVAELHRIDRYQQVARQTRKDSALTIQSSSEDPRYAFPIEAERQLATDFAVLAAWQPTPACVSAASVHCNSESSGLVVTLSANGGIALEVRAFFLTLLDLLKSCARCGTLSPMTRSHVTTRHLLTAPDTSRKDCATACLEAVIGLHRNRILGRLGSPHFKRPKGCQLLDLTRIGLRVKELAKMRGLNGRSSAEASRVFASFKVQLKTFAEAVEVVDRAVKTPSFSGLAGVVLAAYDLTVDGVSLEQRLNTVGYPPETASRREVRQVHAIGRYWRICLDLAGIARSHRRQFKNCSLRVLQHSKAEIWPPQSGKKHHVHAEVQMAVHHEQLHVATTPRVIGTSKIACFLCYHFLRSHGRYLITETHGEVFEQWTVPDNLAHNPNVRASMSAALSKTAAAVTKALRASKGSKSRQGPPMQSVLDLCLQRWRTPSASTLVSRRSLAWELTKDIANATDPIRPALVDVASPASIIANNGLHISPTRSTAAHEPPSHINDEHDSERPPTCRETSSPDPHQARSFANNGRHTNSTLSTTLSTKMPKDQLRYLLDCHNPVHVQAHSLHLFVELQKSTTNVQSTSASCSIQGQESGAALECPYVNMELLGEGEEMTIEIGCVEDQRCFILVCDDKKQYVISIRWHPETGAVQGEATSG